MLEIQLAAIYRARSTTPNGDHAPQIDERAGLSEGHVLTARLRRLRTVPPPPPEEDELGFGAGPLPIDEDDVSIDELLVWERTEERRPIDTRIARLASLLAIGAAVIVLLILMFAAGTDLASVFRSLPGS